MEGKDAEKMDSESPFRLSSGCLFVDVGGLSDDGMLCVGVKERQKSMICWLV